MKMIKRKPQPHKMIFRTGDTVRVLLGKDRGKRGTVMAVLPRQNRVVVEGIALVKKHVRPRRAGEKGQRVSVASSIHASNVQLICPQCKKGSRPIIKHEGAVRQRVCRRCQAIIGK